MFTPVEINATLLTRLEQELLELNRLPWYVLWLFPTELKQLLSTYRTDRKNLHSGEEIASSLNPETAWKIYNAFDADYLRRFLISLFYNFQSYRVFFLFKGLLTGPQDPKWELLVKYTELLTVENWRAVLEHQDPIMVGKLLNVLHKKRLLDGEGGQKNFRAVLATPNPLYNIIILEILQSKGLLNGGESDKNRQAVFALQGARLFGMTEVIRQRGFLDISVRIITLFILDYMEEAVITLAIMHRDGLLVGEDSGKNRQEVLAQQDLLRFSNFLAASIRKVC